MFVAGHSSPECATQISKSYNKCMTKNLPNFHPKPIYILQEVAKICITSSCFDHYRSFPIFKNHVGKEDAASSPHAYEQHSPPCPPSLFLFVQFFLSLCKQAHSVLYCVDAVADQRKDNKHDNYDDSDDKVSSDHDDCGLR